MWHVCVSHARLGHRFIAREAQREVANGERAFCEPVADGDDEGGEALHGELLGGEALDLRADFLQCGSLLACENAGTCRLYNAERELVAVLPQGAGLPLLPLGSNYLRRGNGEHSTMLELLELVAFDGSIVGSCELPTAVDRSCDARGAGIASCSDLLAVLDPPCIAGPPVVAASVTVRLYDVSLQHLETLPLPAPPPGFGMPADDSLVTASLVTVGDRLVIVTEWTVPHAEVRAFSVTSIRGSGTWYSPCSSMSVEVSADEGRLLVCTNETLYCFNAAACLLWTFELPAVWLEPAHWPFEVYCGNDQSIYLFSHHDESGDAEESQSSVYRLSFEPPWGADQSKWEVIDLDHTVDRTSYNEDSDVGA